ncbi:MAG: RNA polymerase sigma factor [Bacteroidota bacterium]|jgi:RNA polymerase sigma-70 factor (ECF subfamily)
MSDDNDEAVRLLDRIAAGEESAMADFYGRFSRQVYAFALRSCGRPEEAEDVVVEAMYEVWKSAGRFAGGSQVRTWLFSIARHKLIDRVRRAGPRHTVELDDVADGLADDDPSAFERLARAQNADALKGCMARLSPEHRECVHLVFFGELALAEVAAVQGCPENTVKTRLFHAKRQLRRCLERRLGSEGIDD